MPQGPGLFANEKIAGQRFPVPLWFYDDRLPVLPLRDNRRTVASNRQEVIRAIRGESCATSADRLSLQSSQPGMRRGVRPGSSAIQVGWSARFGFAVQIEAYMTAAFL